MSSVEVGSATTAFLGVLWAVLAALTPTGDGDTLHNVIIGAAIALAGLATLIAARRWDW